MFGERWADTSGWQRIFQKKNLFNKRRRHFLGNIQSFLISFLGPKDHSFNVLLKKAHEGLCFLFVSWEKKMMKLWMVTSLELAELFVSAMVHLLYAFYIFSTAVAGDISKNVNDYFFKSNMDVNDSDQSQSNVEGLPPIVLVHGIFGFGKGVMQKT